MDRRGEKRRLDVWGRRELRGKERGEEGIQGQRERADNRTREEWLVYGEEGRQGRGDMLGGLEGKTGERLW